MINKSSRRATSIVGVVVMARRLVAFYLFLLLRVFVVGAVPSTFDGPFTPRTVAFDASLRRGSADLLPTDPRVVKTVVGDAPEQLALALSTPDALWVSWITGTLKSLFLLHILGFEAFRHA